MNILKEIEAIREYLFAHDDELIAAIKEANLENVKNRCDYYVAVYVDDDDIQLTTLPSYADDIRMIRTDGNDPYLAYKSDMDSYTIECICDLGDGKVAETDEEIMRVLDDITIWRDEAIKVYDKLDDIACRYISEIKAEDRER